ERRVNMAVAWVLGFLIAWLSSGSGRLFEMRDARKAKDEEREESRAKPSRQREREEEEDMDEEEEAEEDTSNDSIPCLVLGYLAAALHFLAALLSFDVNVSLSWLIMPQGILAVLAVLFYLWFRH
ncbi:hypothetical protein KIPB_010339, partial [Kipferlia bialata]